MRRVSVLRLVLSVEHSSAPYHQFSLAARGRHDVTLCTFFPPALQVPDDIALHPGDGTVGGFVRALGAALAERRHDVIHVHHPHVGLLLLLRPEIWRRRPRRPPIVFTVHNSFPNYSPRNRLLLLPMVAAVERVVCCGHEARASIPEPLRRLAGRRLCAIPNGIDLGRIARALGRAERGTAGDGPFTIISVGRLVPIKDPATLLAAFRLAAPPDARLVFVGDGPLRAALEEDVARSGPAGRVHLVGAVPRDDVYDRCRRAHLFVSVSRGEGLPIAVLEAMACGLPAVLSDISSHREITGGAPFIPLVAPGDAAGFGHAIAGIAALSAERRAEVGHRCRQVAEGFDADIMLARYDALYRDLAGLEREEIARLASH